MRQHLYSITLTNGTTEQEYSIWAFNEKEAIILAQAEAIKLARGYELIGIVENKMSRVI